MKNLRSVLIVIVMVSSVMAAASSPVSFQKANQDPAAPTRLVLANLDGMSLYTFKPDAPNESNCYESCAQAWPPVLVDKEQADLLKGVLGTAIRRDGSLQLSIDGQPVYLFAGDQIAGDIKGEGLGGVWFLLDLKTVK